MHRYIYHLADTYFIFKEKELIADLSPGLKSQAIHTQRLFIEKDVSFLQVSRFTASVASIQKERPDAQTYTYTY